MTSNVKARICLAAIGLTLSGVLSAQTPSFITDSTMARYRYEVEEYTISQIPAGTGFEDVDISERDLLKPLHHHYLVTTGVNNNYQPYTQIQNLETTELEDWMSTPEFQLLAPSGSYGLNETGEVLYHFPPTETEIQDNDILTADYSTNGYLPIMLFFPNIHDEFVEEAQLDGAILYELDNDAFQLVWPDMEITFEPETKTITEWVLYDDKEVVTETKYSLFTPYGYVVKSIHEESARTDIDYPVTFATSRQYTNHVIEDMGQMIPKYTEMAYIELHPVPVEDQYDVVFKGVPDAQVSQVQIRDYMGNIVHTHYAPDVTNDMMTLDSHEYPSGVLIIIVYTQHGVYTETITKS